MASCAPIECWRMSSTVAQYCGPHLEAVAIGVAQMEGLLYELKVTDAHAAQTRVCSCQPGRAHLLTGSQINEFSTESESLLLSMDAHEAHGRQCCGFALTAQHCQRIAGASRLSAGVVVGAPTLNAVTCCTVTARLSLVPATPNAAAEQCTVRASSDSACPLENEP